MSTTKWVWIPPCGGRVGASSGRTASDASRMTKNDFASLRHFSHTPMQLAGATPDPRGGFPPRTPAEGRAREATRTRCACPPGDTPGPWGETGLPPVCVGRAGRADRLPRPLLAAWFSGSEGERGGLRAVARCVSKRVPYSGSFPYLLPPSPSRRWPSRDQKPAARCCSRSRAASAAWMRSRRSAFSRSRPFTRSCKRAFSICRAA